MTGNNDCPHRKNIDCPYLGAVVFCKKCGFYPAEEKRRKAVLLSNIGQIEGKRSNYIMQLKIKRFKRNVSYTVQPVRKRTPSRKTRNQLINEQGAG